MPKYILLLSLISLFLAGCSVSGGGGSADLTSSQRLPERFSLPQPETPRDPVHQGAIFNGARGLELFRDNRAREVGDILMIRVVEVSRGESEAETSLERKSALTGGISSFFGLERWVAERNPRFTPSATSMRAEMTNRFDGSGDTERNSRVTATISARVVDKTMDGNLVLRGYQEVRVNNETQFIIISGLVRPDDITSDNSVLSSRIADSRIEYSGRGVIADKQRQGWLSRTIDAVFPF